MFTNFKISLFSLRLQISHSNLISYINIFLYSVLPWILSSRKRRTDTITHSVCHSEASDNASITGRHALSACSDLYADPMTGMHKYLSQINFIDSPLHCMYWVINPYYLAAYQYHSQMGLTWYGYDDSSDERNELPKFSLFAMTWGFSKGVLTNFSKVSSASVTPWCCKCPWVMMIIYHQRTFFWYLVNKNTNNIHQK